MILVTGGMSGIGAALTARLRGRGEAVLVLDRHPGADIVCDLADPAAIDAAALDVPALSGLALVAGVPGTVPGATVVAVNLHAPVRLTRLLVDRLGMGSAIVAVSSITAHRCAWDEARLRALIDGASEPLEGAMAYEASKCALNLWVQIAAATLHPRVRVNSVSPGPVETPILADFETSMGKGRLDAAVRLTGRHGRADDIAAVIDWLLTGDSAWVNGTDLKVDGGFHALRAVSKLAR